MLYISWAIEKCTSMAWYSERNTLERVVDLFQNLFLGPFAVKMICFGHTTLLDLLSGGPSLELLVGVDWARPIILPDDTTTINICLASFRINFTLKFGHSSLAHQLQPSKWQFGP